MNATRQIVSLTALWVGLTATSGCASYAVREMNDPEPRYYPGMRDDARMIVQPSRVTWAAPARTERVIFGTLDIVPSGVVDTLCLPFELTMPPRSNWPPDTAPQPTPTNREQAPTTP